jgi:hypothetical protein
MPLVPIPHDLGAVRLAGLAVVLLLVTLTAPAILFWSLAAPRQSFHLELLREFRSWTTELVDTHRPARRGRHL